MVRGFNGFFIPVPLITVCAITVGGYIALDRWLRVNDERSEGRSANLPRGFSALVASVISSSVSLAFSTTAVFWNVSQTGLLHHAVVGLYILCLLAAATFAGLAVRSAYQRAPTSKLSIRFSATVVFVLEMVCVMKTIASSVGVVVVNLIAITTTRFY